MAVSQPTWAWRSRSDRRFLSGSVFQGHSSFSGLQRPATSPRRLSAFRFSSSRGAVVLGGSALCSRLLQGSSERAWPTSCRGRERRCFVLKRRSCLRALLFPSQRFRLGFIKLAGEEMHEFRCGAPSRATVVPCGEPGGVQPQGCASPARNTRVRVRRGTMRATAISRHERSFSRKR